MNSKNDADKADDAYVGFELVKDTDGHLEYRELKHG